MKLGMVQDSFGLIHIFSKYHVIQILVIIKMETIMFDMILFWYDGYLWFLRGTGIRTQSNMILLLSVVNPNLNIEKNKKDLSLI